MSLDTKPQWVFEHVNPMGGARATTWQDTLEGSDLSTEARIAREAIQNSVDATLEGKKTGVLVWDKSLSGQEVTKFSDLIGLNSPGSPTTRLSKLGLGDPNSFERIRTGTGDIRVTIIEDYDTCGLGYDEKDRKDRFEELCLFLGQESTAVDGSRGGSYGFGKTVYQASSDCRTFLVYSVFQPKAETSHHHARLFGCSSFDGHSIEGTKYTGRAWFGLPGTSESGQRHCDPVVDEAAHDLARRLGFVRDKEDIGTSIMIIGSEIDMDRFREAVEDYWWPRLVSDKLSVELWEGNDDELPPPEPLVRQYLLPYIRCYNLINDNNIPLKDDEHRPRMNAQRGSDEQRGELVLKALPPDGPDAKENPEDDTQFENTVALIRSRPLMVVRYFVTGGRQRGNFVGTFLSHPDSEQALHLSEPQSHDSWNPNSERLRRAESGSGRRYRQLVEGILSSIKRQARVFQGRLNPSPTPVPVPGTRKLQQILARIMPSTGLGTPNPRPSRDPFRVRIREGRTNTATKSAVTAEIEVGLKDDAPFDHAVVVMSLRPTIVLDDNKQRYSSERLGLSSITVDGEEVGIDGSPDFSLSIAKASPVSVEARSEGFDRDLYADLEVSIVLPEQQIPGL